MKDPAPKYRKHLLNALKGEEFENILELGCGYGENLFAIRKKYKADCAGIDIDGIRTEEANKTRIKEGIKGVEILQGDATDTTIYPEKSYDIVFTYALLLMVTGSVAIRIIENALKIAKKKVIFIEMYNEKGEMLEIKNGKHRYSRNYEEILKGMGVKEVEKIRIPKKDWPGESYLSYGYIIKAEL
jgi:ubiquinone/menaquinone biosynthesis C-methylase UbiE